MQLADVRADASSDLSFLPPLPQPDYALRDAMTTWHEEQTAGTDLLATALDKTYAPKVYTHMWDEHVASCRVDPKSKTAHRLMLTHSWAFKWLKQRLADELTMHILHAFGVLRWRT